MGKANNKGSGSKHIAPSNQTRKCTGTGAFFFCQNYRIFGKDRLRKRGNITPDIPAEIFDYDARFFARNIGNPQMLWR